jgi:uncharacterized protein YqfA (UPF0365 family)
MTRLAQESMLIAANANPGNMFHPVMIVGVILALVVVLGVVMIARYFNLYVQALMANANIGLIELVCMGLRKVNANIIVRSKIMAVQAGLTDKDGVTRQGLEAHYLAGSRAHRGGSGRYPALVEACVGDRPRGPKRA